MCALGEFFAVGVEAVGDAAEECGAGFAAGLRVACEGFGGEPGGVIELLRCGGVKRLEGLAGLGIEGVECGAVTRAALRTEEGESGEFHNKELSRPQARVSGEVRGVIHRGFVVSLVSKEKFVSSPSPIPRRRDW